ncbi:hypothetical protein MYCTH_2110233 [Thermothelomyces thermophilus ATCC 42464]|uniref:F-box domain-containing protein n=1 Tax=Thermothelomyces thermophilus (strain ATCC 42464 / BCRC 31852 / DSM 1799) TaxID=573729 RepID=G2QBB3_THET4|nr:uncharacterized protein MYCTH_2110233 [Thermothelomyces thermophilus ATCC 42464]AEO57856.1 hypothetical protein MYCTH_2110233 [Thermothelomyces thermophilus ATCC 42464]
MSGRASMSFPQEIWWLVAKELANRLDVDGLFLCARLSRGMARLALPELYAIHDQSPAINAHVLDIERFIGLWRSIIISSLGKTLFPYCCWIKVLRLGTLDSQLEDLAHDTSGLRDLFFSPPLENLQIRRCSDGVLDIRAIILEVAHMITDCIRTSAEQQGKLVGLTALEGYHLPAANLRILVLGLSSLTSLFIRDGYVLTSDVARAIRANCPAFRELECFYCYGTKIDEEFGGFLRNLEPNTLVSFTILNKNEVARETFRALCVHSQSLKNLDLLSLDLPAFHSLDELRHCLSLESLKLGPTPEASTYPWHIECKDAFEGVVRWLQNCTSLSDLGFTVVPLATTLLAQVLKSPAVHLEGLKIETMEFDIEFCSSLAHQQQLQHLTLRIWDEDLLDADDQRRAVFAAAIARCRNLRELDTNELFSLEDLDRICSSLPLLETMAVTGTFVDDEFLLRISRLSTLKRLFLYGPSFEVLLRFLGKLAADPEGHHEGLQLHIPDQVDTHMTEQKEAQVATIIKELFGGRLEYHRL